MDHLRAPWRLAYVANPAEKSRPATADECFICRGVNGTDDRANLLVHRSEHAVVVLNRFPYNNGHLLIAPRVHEGRPDRLAPEVLLDLQHVLWAMMQIIERRMAPDGFNVGRRQSASPPACDGGATAAR